MTRVEGKNFRGKNEEGQTYRKAQGGRKFSILGGDLIRPEIIQGSCGIERTKKKEKEKKKKKESMETGRQAGTAIKRSTRPARLPCPPPVSTPTIEK